MNENNDRIEMGEQEKNHSIFTLISFALISFGSGAAFNFISSFGFAFWEVEVGLPVLFVSLAFSIYGVWNGINDPLVGYFSDKTYRYTKRWGRRFPWILFGNIPITIFLFLIFLPPDVDPVENTLFLFLWLTILLCAFELFGSMGYVNQSSLYPQKFRTDRDRRYSTGISLIVSIFMLLFGMVLPPLLIEYGNKTSYLTGALIIMVIAVPFVILGIPGIREDKHMIEQVLRSDEERVKVGFFTMMKRLVKNRNFLATIAIYIPLNAYGTLALGSVYYFVRYVLELDPSYMTVILVSFILGQLVATPFWTWIVGKIGSLKVIYITVIGSIIALSPTLWVTELGWALFVGFTTAFFTRGFDCADEPLFAYLIDDVVVHEGYRVEGTYYGVRSFILRVELPISATIIGVTHVITGFDPSLETQTDLAKWGIRSHMALAPIIMAIIGVVIFWLLWNLTSEKVMENKAKLKELDL